ncbi:MAG: winged helix-turn-helix transcriptional regulator [Dehalococcoidales bacterium]|nr:winged helix-turn-helix transcriptional regulator [Dehalococcoidales bacterium]
MAVIQEYFDYDDGYLKISFKSHRVIVKDSEIKLARMEFKLLNELFNNIGTVVEYDALLSKIWGYDYRDARGYLHDHIYSLRQKIEPDINNPKYIITVPGFGYRFEDWREKYEKKSRDYLRFIC